MPPAYRTHGAPSAPLAWRAKGCAIALDGAPERRQSLSEPHGSPARKMGRPLERWATARAPSGDLRAGAILYYPLNEPGAQGNQSSHAGAAGSPKRRVSRARVAASKAATS